MAQHKKQDGQFVLPLDDRTPILPKIEMGVQSPKGTSRPRRNSLYRSVHQKALCRTGAQCVEVGLCLETKEEFCWRCCVIGTTNT